MIAEVGRAPMALGAVLGTAAVGGITGEAVQTIGIITSFVAVVVTGFAWLDARMDKKIEKNAQRERELANVRMQALVIEIKEMVATKVSESVAAKVSESASMRHAVGE